MARIVFVARKANLVWRLILPAAVLLAAVVQFTQPAKAEEGLTIEVTRNGNMLIATAETAAGSHVLEDSWRALKASECNVGLFAAMSGVEEAGNGWSVTLSSADADAEYCFYVKDSQDRTAAQSFKVVRPTIKLTQNNDQLGASVTNTESDSLQIDESSWRWFRYEHVDGSHFGCSDENFGLDDEGLRRVALMSESRQTGDLSFDVYAMQKDVYKSGTGVTVELVEEDTGFTYCFGVADVAGIGNVRRLEISKVTASPFRGNKQPVDDIFPAPDPGQVGLNPLNPDGSLDGDGGINVTGIADSQSTGGGTMRQVGLGLLAAALIVGAVALIRGAQIKDDELEAEEARIRSPERKK